MSDEQARDILDAAWAGGIRYFDTAPHYGLGLSECRLGAFLQTKPRHEFVISTKVGRLIRANPDWRGAGDHEGFDVPGSLRREVDFSGNGIRASHAESLERLGLDRVDILYLHDPERSDLALGLRTAIPALRALRSEGAVAAIGVGSMSVEALLASARTPSVDLLMVAGRFTLADQSIAPEVLGACRANGIGIVNASVFNSGLLASDDPTETSRHDYGDLPDGLLYRVRRIREICQRFDVPLPVAALRFAGRDNNVRSVVIAGSNPSQIEQNIAWVHRTVPEELWAALGENGLIAGQSYGCGAYSEF